MCMAEGSTCYGMTDSDITAMKEALQAQQLLLQKLYLDLDEERESSATAASEALSMILRLQGEKAAVKMEASQYKRLAEEKICHAEESLEIFEDVIYQKEMEIASLEFQVQAYKCKLLSLGFSDLGATENRFPENLLFQGSDLSNGETNAICNVRRINSLPPIPLKDSQQKKSIGEGERESFIIPILDLVRKEVDQEVSVQSLNTEKKSGFCRGGEFSSYWEQIKVLDERVKEISHSKDTGRDKSTNLEGRFGSCSLPSQASTSTSCDQTRPGIITSLDQENDNYNQQESEENASTSCSSNVHDIFEVPQTDEIWKIHEHQKKLESKLTVDAEDRLGKPDLVAREIDELCVKDEADCLKKMLLCTNHESTLCKLRGSVNCNVALVCPTTGVAESQAKFQQLSRRIDQLEGERNSTSQEISYAGDEERKLLREIHEQLHQLRAEIHNWGMNKSPPQDEQLTQIQTENQSRRIKKSPPHDEQPLLSVTEAMLHFWL